MRQARGRLLSAAIMIGALSAVATWSPTAHAQEGKFGKMSERGFGNRDEFVFSVERIFGFEHQKICLNSCKGELGDNDSIGFQPFLWGGIGFWDVSDTGLTFGTLVGATYFRLKDDSSKDELMLFTLRPRIGYALSQNEFFGFWLRVGPTLFYAHSHNEFDIGTRTESHNEGYFTFGIGGEAYAVITPVPHFGILFGPIADIHVKGSTTASGENPEYTAYGLTSGIMGEFY